MNYNHFVSCAALVTNQNGEILLVKSPLRGWEYPGGLIEPRETFQQALKREVREEAGIEIEITGFVGICKNVGKDIVNIDFTARYIGGELTTSEESTEVIWATPEQAMNLITFPLTKKRLSNMLSDHGNASLFCFDRKHGFEVVEDFAYPVGKRLPMNIGKCGFYCGSCPSFRTTLCKGCMEEHIAGDCFTRDCVIDQQLQFCGECVKFPCETILQKEKCTVLDKTWLQWKHTEKTK